MPVDRLYFRQLLSGRDFAANDMFAQQMRNFAYLIGDRETGDCVVVDPAYAAQDLVDALEADDMHLSGVLVTHHHPDHVGGSMMGFELKGLASTRRAAFFTVQRPGFSARSDNSSQWSGMATGARGFGRAAYGATACCA